MNLSVGWIGLGNMGRPMAARVAPAGFPLTVWNRTPSRADPLVNMGAARALSIRELATCDVVFSTVTGSADLHQVLLDPEVGLLTGSRVPEVAVDCSTVSVEVSTEVRKLADERLVAYLACPVSGNGGIAAAGGLSLACSGPMEAFDRMRPVLDVLGQSATYVGPGESARLVKIYHNLLLGAITEALAEILALASKSDMRRGDVMNFINGSVLGSTFIGYKTPSLVDLDFTPTFNCRGLLKDFDLGAAESTDKQVPMPVIERTRQALLEAIDAGLGDLDFASLLLLAAMKAGVTLADETSGAANGLTS